jgi:hypothetical protein
MAPTIRIAAWLLERLAQQRRLAVQVAQSSVIRGVSPAFFRGSM